MDARLIPFTYKLEKYLTENKVLKKIPSVRIITKFISQQTLVNIHKVN